MTNSRPSARQLQAFHKALQQASQEAQAVPSLSELARRRDAFLASLKV